MANVLAKINRLPIFTATFAALVGFNIGLAVLKLAA